MAIQLFFGGVLNQMFLGIPYYLWAIVTLVLLGMIICALFYFFFWWRLTPYHGIFWAHLRKIGASFVFDENLHFDLITDRSSKVIFNETLKEAQEAEEDKTESPAATIGKVRADFVFDPDKWTFPDSYQHKIVESVAENWNMEHPEDQVRTLMKFSRYLHEGRFNEDDVSGLKHEIVVPWPRIQMMYKDRDESGTFGFVMTLANTIKELEKESLNKYGLYFLGLFALIDIAIIITHFLTKKPI